MDIGFVSNVQLVGVGLCCQLECSHVQVYHIDDRVSSPENLLIDFECLISFEPPIPQKTALHQNKSQENFQFTYDLKHIRLSNAGVMRVF